MIINIRVYQYINLFNMDKCYNCSRITNIQKYYTKFITDENDIELYCDTCYEEKEKFDNNLIKTSIQMKQDVKEIVKPKFIVNYIIPLKIYKEVSEVINGINTEFVVIEKEAYNDYMKKVAFSNDKLVNDEYINKIIIKQQKEAGVELARVNGIKEKERREKREEQDRERKKVKQIEMDRFNNDKYKKEKQEFIEERKEDLKQEGAKIEKCVFCKEFKVYPKDYKDDNNKTFLKQYTINKIKTKCKCCMDCYFKTKDKQEDYIREHQETCPYCKTVYRCMSQTDKDRHLNTNKCLRVQEETVKYDENKKRILLMKVKDLREICKKTLNDDGTYRIANYSNMKKDELLEKMMAIYDLLVLSN